MVLQTSHQSSGISVTSFTTTVPQRLVNMVFLLWCYVPTGQKVPNWIGKEVNDVFTFAILGTKDMLITSARFFMDYSWSRKTGDKGVNKLLSAPEDTFVLPPNICRMSRCQADGTKSSSFRTNKNHFLQLPFGRDPGIWPGIQWCNFKRASEGLELVEPDELARE